MPLAIPAELKKISPFVRRAEELDKDNAPESRLVAYYCRQYAVHTGIPLSQTQASKVCLGHILEMLEKEKPAMDNFTREEASFLCRQFAYRVFDKANGEDRMGLANQSTAKTFYAASTFLQMLEQFASDGTGETDEDFVEIRKRIIYSKWKSTDIMKAIKEGRTPTPGGYGEEDPIEDDEEDRAVEVSETKIDAPADGLLADDAVGDKEDTRESLMMLPSSTPVFPLAPPMQESFVSSHDESETEKEDEEDMNQGTEVELDPPPAYPGESGSLTTSFVDRPKIKYVPPNGQPSGILKDLIPPPVKVANGSGSGGGKLFGFGWKKSNGKASKAQLADAVELTRFALAALEDKDGDLAAERLQQALQALGR